VSQEQVVNNQEFEALASRLSRNERELHEFGRVVGEYGIKLAGVDTKLSEIGRQLGRMADKESRPLPWGALIAAAMLLITLATLALNPVYSDRTENNEEHRKLNERIYQQQYNNGRQDAQLEMLHAIELARVQATAMKEAQ